MKSLTKAVAALAAMLLATAPAATAADKIGGTMILATTTSTVDSGLLEALMPKFKDMTGVEVKIIGIGSGAALAMAGKGDADAVLSHAPEAEQKYVKKGDLVEGALIMHNDFVLLGPPSDPAEVKSSPSLKDALSRIAAAGPFISRGDDSGTHKAELELWRAAGVDVKAFGGTWYRSTGSGMGATLNTASGLGAYALADRGTWASFKNKGDLAIVVEGDRRLFNQYGVMLVNPARHPHVKAKDGQAFIDWLIAPEGQKAIAAFNVEGQSLFFPNYRKTGS